MTPINQEHQKQETPLLPTRITKSIIARMYGRTWRSFRDDVYTLIPELRGCRRRILRPKEIALIYNTFGPPSVTTEHVIVQQ